MPSIRSASISGERVPGDPRAAYAERTGASRAAHERAKQVMPAGVTGNVKLFDPYPLFMRRGKGSKLWDVDGNRYIDYCLCFGPLIVGHGHPAVLAALRRQLTQQGTTMFGTPHELEITMGEKLIELIPSAELVRYTNSGLEATLHATRAARAYTGRSKLAKFEGHYHGAWDQVLISLNPPKEAVGPPRTPAKVSTSKGTTPGTLEETVVLPWGDLEATESLLRANQRELAAVIMEPVPRAIPPDPTFLKGIRELTEELGILLIFDEVMSGFRIGIGGAQAHYGVTPDLTALGKIIGGGLPAGAFVGRKDIMEAVSPVGKKTGEYVMHGSTFAGCPSVLAAGLATLEILERPETYPALNGLTDRLKEGLNNLFQKHDVAARAEGIGSIFNLWFTDQPVRGYRDTLLSDAAKRSAFDYGLLSKGVFVKPGKPFYTSTAHTQTDLRGTLKVADETLEEFLAGPSKA